MRCDSIAGVVVFGRTFSGCIAISVTHSVDSHKTTYLAEQPSAHHALPAVLVSPAIALARYLVNVPRAVFGCLPSSAPPASC